MFFKNCSTIEELKKEYKALAFKYHSDINKNANPEIMKKINVEYDAKFKEIASKHNKTVKNTKNHIKFSEMQENHFKKVISKITVLENSNVKIEIVGSWIWVFGNGTFSIKENLKSLGFKWSKNRKKWYLAPIGSKSYSKKGYRSKYKSYKDIKNTYGSLSVEKEKTKILN